MIVESGKKMFRQIVKKGRIELLLAFLTLFNITLNYYLVTQGLLILESNQLLTGHEVSTTRSHGELLEIDALNKIDYRLFAQIDAHLSDDIWIFYSNNFTNWRPPLSDGNFFRSSDTLEVVVGRNVELIQREQGAVYVFNGQTYNVIGTLGLLTPSLLDNMVLINDSDLLQDYGLSLIIDADDSEALQLALGESAFTSGGGIGMIFEIDFFTPMISIYSQLISGLLVIIIAYLFNLEVHDEVKIRHLIGEHRFITFRRISVLLTIRLRAAVILLALSFWLFSRSLNIQELMMQGLFLLALLILSHTFIFFRKKIWRTL